MAVEPITSATPSATTGNLASVQDFLKILLTQLTYQDPLKPVDNQQFMAQLAQFTALEQTQQINNKIDALLSTQSALQSVGLLGRTVQLSAEAGGATGTVSRIALQDGVPTLELTLSPGNVLPAVRLSQVVSVR